MRAGCAPVFPGMDWVVPQGLTHILDHFLDVCVIVRDARCKRQQAVGKQAPLAYMQHLCDAGTKHSLGLKAATLMIIASYKDAINAHGC